MDKNENNKQGLMFESEGLLTQLKKINGLQHENLENINDILSEIEIVLLGRHFESESDSSPEPSSEYVNVVRGLGENLVSTSGLLSRLSRLKDNLKG